MTVIDVENETFLTVEQVCDHLKISRATLYRQMNKGRIPFLRFGNRYRIPKSGLEDALNSILGASDD